MKNVMMIATSFSRKSKIYRTCYAKAESHDDCNVLLRRVLEYVINANAKCHETCHVVVKETTIRENVARMQDVVFTKKPHVKIMLIVMNAECNVVTKET